MSNPQNLIKVYLFNKKEDIERSINEGGPDLFRKGIDGLIEMIENNKQALYDRRKEIIGVGIVYAEGKFIYLLDEAIRAYQLGLFYSTISLCSMAAERICYDYIDMSEIVMRNVTLNDEQKQELYNIPLARLIDFIFKLGWIDNKSRSVLLEINTIRNQHVHPKMTRDAKADSIKVLNLLCKVTENLLSVFKYYDIINGKLVKKSN